MENDTDTQATDPVEVATTEENTNKAAAPETTDCGCEGTAPKVTEDDVLGAIEEVKTETVTLVGKPHTVTAVRLRNGFTIVETSTCVSVENYDPQIGEDINLAKIKNKIWLLLGYLLQEQLHGEANPATKSAVLVSLHSLLQTAKGSGQLSDEEIDAACEQITDAVTCAEFDQGYQQRAIAEHECLSNRVTELDEFIASNKFDDTDPNEQTRLRSLRTQLKAMKSYESVLRLRIANFRKED